MINNVKKIHRKLCFPRIVGLKYKAFEVVDHSILFKKPIIYRFNSKSMAILQSSDRQQAVVQGNGLPTISLIYINDLPLFMNYCYSDFFANDAQLSTPMISKIVNEYDQEIPQSLTTPWHREEEPPNHHETPGRQIKQSNQLSLPHQDDCNTRIDIK